MVVPAKAGTHNHRKICSTTIPHKLYEQGVWVPAFAGTTRGEIVR